MGDILRPRLESLWMQLVRPHNEYDVEGLRKWAKISESDSKPRLHPFFLKSATSHAATPQKVNCTADRFASKLREAHDKIET